MSRRPDGTNPYGRFLELMKNSAPKVKGIIRGEYLAAGKFRIGDQTLSPGDYTLVQNTFILDGHTFTIPGLSPQTHTVSRTVTHYGGGRETFSFSFEVPAMVKGDRVVAYQFGDGGYVILGKVV